MRRKKIWVKWVGTGLILQVQLCNQRPDIPTVLRWVMRVTEFFLTCSAFTVLADKPLLGAITISFALTLFWGIAPLLDGRLLDFPWIHLGHCTDLFWHIYTILRWFQFGYKLCYMFASTNRLHVTMFNRVVNHHCLHLVLALNWALAMIKSK